MVSASIYELLTRDNVVFRAWAFWGAALIVKTLAMSFLTAIQRFRTKTFANPEDLPSKKMQVKMNDPNVERVRRAHLNDLENVIPFLLVSFLYVLTNPAAGLATMLIRVAALARFAHSFVYAVVVIPQPARAIAFAIPYFICFYMGVVSMGHFFYI